MNKISHDMNDETIEAKVRWFRALPLSERMEMLCNFTDLALELNPDLAGKKDAQPIKDHVRIRVVDLEDVRLLELPNNKEDV